MSLPLWRWEWARWMLGHAEYKVYGPKSMAHRPGPPVPPPGQIPQPVKDWYYRTFAKDIAALYPPPPPKPVVTSPFAGRGCFTAHDPLCLVREGIADRFAWVALKGDGEDHAAVWDVTALLNAGVKRVHVWYSLDGPMVLGPGAGCHIYQDEGLGQREEALRRSVIYPGPKALVSNVWAPDWPDGYVALCEEYANTTNKPLVEVVGGTVQTALNRGAKEAYPVFGVGTWGDAVRTVPLADYLAIWGPDNWSCYLGETLLADDVAYLKSLPR